MAAFRRGAAKPLYLRKRVARHSHSPRGFPLCSGDKGKVCDFGVLSCADRSAF